MREKIDALFADAESAAVAWRRGTRLAFSLAVLREALFFVGLAACLYIDHTAVSWSTGEALSVVVPVVAANVAASFFSRRAELRQRRAWDAFTRKSGVIEWLAVCAVTQTNETQGAKSP